jgi:hypothetical protein
MIIHDLYNEYNIVINVYPELGNTYQWEKFKRDLHGIKFSHMIYSILDYKTSCVLDDFIPYHDFKISNGVCGCFIQLINAPRDLIQFKIDNILTVGVKSFIESLTTYCYYEYGIKVSCSITCTPIGNEQFKMSRDYEWMIL